MSLNATREVSTLRRVGTSFTETIEANQILQQEETSMLLYRHMNKRWVERFRTMGKLQLKALTHYRTIGDVRQDETEGLKKTSVMSGSFTREQCKEFFGIDIVEGLAIGENQLETGLEQRTNVVTGDVAVNAELPAGYLICVSMTNTREVADRFRTDGYFTIIDPHHFVKSVAKKNWQEVGCNG